MTFDRLTAGQLATEATEHTEKRKLNTSSVLSVASVASVARRLSAFFFLVLVSGTSGALIGGEVAATGATWHVAVDGNDTAPGTLDRPFASITRAQQAVAPGDTVLIRGGTYRMTEAQIAEKKDIYARIFALNKSGTPGKRITYRAYTGEEPIFDCTRSATAASARPFSGRSFRSRSASTSSSYSP